MEKKIYKKKKIELFETQDKYQKNIYLKRSQQIKNKYINTKKLIYI